MNNANNVHIVILDLCASTLFVEPILYVSFVMLIDERTFVNIVFVCISVLVLLLFLSVRGRFHSKSPYGKQIIDKM